MTATYTVDALNIASAGRGADIDEKHFSLLNGLDFAVVVLARADDSLQDGGLHIDFDVDLRHAAWVANDVTNHVVAAGELGVYLGAHRNQTAWDGVHQLVEVGLQRHDHALDLSPGGLACPLRLGYFARSDGDLVTDLQTALENGAASDAALEGFGVLTRLVHVEGANDNHVGRHGELTGRDWDAADIVDHDVDVVAQHGRDGDNRNGDASGAGQRLLNLLLLLSHGNLVFDDQVNFVLQHNDVLQVHNIHGDQVLSCLRLGVRLVTGYQQQGSVHDGGSSQHGGHEGVVTWAIDEGDVASEDKRRVALLAVDRIGLGRVK